jgi:hypothetical protein
VTTDQRVVAKQDIQEFESLSSPTLRGRKPLLLPLFVCLAVHSSLRGRVLRAVARRFTWRFLNGPARAIEPREKAVPGWPLVFSPGV